MQGLRYKFGERRNEWKCCFCCHVRTGTIFLGVWHLMLQVLAMSMLLVIFRNPELMMEEDTAPALPTPLSEVDAPRVMQTIENSQSVDDFLDRIGTPIDKYRAQLKKRGIEYRSEGHTIGKVWQTALTYFHRLLLLVLVEHVSALGRHLQIEYTELYCYYYLQSLKLKMASMRQNMLYENKKQETTEIEDLHLAVVITCCTFAITLLMVYGAIKGKPAYLMPFFCMQVFDFCIAGLSALSYLCYIPNMHHLVAENSQIPLQAQLLSLPPQCLSLLVLLTFVIAMLIKIYFIGVVWGCYKFLTLRIVSAQRTIQFIDTEFADSQGTLLPDYETALKFPTPPPSYASATAPATVTIQSHPDPSATASVSTSASATATTTTTATSAASQQLPQSA